LEDDENHSTHYMTKSEHGAKRREEAVQKETENYEKGVLFEKYVIEMFDQKYFAVHDWTRDLSGKTNGVIVESDANPDIVMRYKTER